MIVIKEADHRKFPRRSFCVRVRVLDRVRGRDVTAEAVDINPMGMALNIRRGLNVGEVVTLRIPSPEGDYTLTVEGQVVRRTAEQVGIEFFDLDDWIFEELCAYVYSHHADRHLVLAVDAAHA